MNQMFWMMNWNVGLEMRSLSEWTFTKLTFVRLNASMYHIMPSHFVIVWKSFATIWARVATRFSRDRKELFPSTRCQWGHAVHCESVTCGYQIWNKNKGRLLYQVVILNNYIPFQIGTALKGKNSLSEGANSFLLEQFLVVWKIPFTTLGELPWV